MKSKHDAYPFPRFLLTTLVLIVAVILVVGYFCYDDQRNQLLQEKFDDLSAVADLKVHQLVKWRSERLLDALYFKENGEFAKSVEQFAKRPGSVHDRRKLLEWLLPLLKNPEYRLVVLLDPQGTELVRVGEQKETVGRFARESIRRAQRTGVVDLSDFHYGVQSHIHLDLPVPISLNTGMGAKVVGTLLFRIDPWHRLYPLVQSWPTPSRTAETLLVKRDGEDVLFLNELRHRKGTALVLRMPVTMGGLVSTMATRGAGGNLKGKDYRGVSVLATAREIGGSPWILIAKMDREEILTSFVQRSWLMAVVIALLILTVGALVALCWRHQRARFYRDLYHEERARRVLASRVEYLTRNANDIMLLLDATYRVIEANEKALEVYGYSWDEITRIGLGELRCITLLPDLDERIHQVMAEGGLVFESVHRRKDGSCFPVESSIRYLEMDGQAFFQAIVRDISERKKAEQRIERLSHMYQALSQVNHCIVHGKNSKELIVAICRTIVAHGRFTMAWVGLVDMATRLVVPVGWYGCEDGYLSEAEISVDDVPKGRGPTGRAIREGIRVICQNIGDDPIMAPWREGALARGYHSSAAFPLFVDGECVGALMVYALISEFFDDEIVSLLDELTSNLSHALESLRRDEALERSRERLLFAMKSSSMWAWDWNLAENEYLWDDCMHAMIGVEPGKLPCRIEDLISIVHPVDRERVRQELQTVLADGSEYESKYQVIRPDGTSRFVHAKGRLHRDEQGNPVRMAGVAWDITDKIQKSLRQRQQKELLRTMLDTIPVMICYFDTDGCLKWTNAEWEKTIGWSLLELNSEEVLEKCCPDTEYRSDMMHFFATADGTWADFRVNVCDGSVLLTTWAAVRLSDETILAIGQNITERMRAKEEILSLNAGLEERVRQRTAQLEEANRDLEAFSYSVSHDLRAPLRAVKGFASILRDDYAEGLGEEGLNFSDLIVQNAEKMGQLIEHLLSFSRIGREKMTLNAISMTELVRSVIDELASREQCGHIEFQLEALPDAKGDESMIRQVWMNLLGNALKFTLPKGVGRIEVSSLPGKEENVYRVKDSGVGFDGALAHKAFGIFQRLHSSADFEGSGVGLAIVQRIVTCHGGKVWAEGVPGEGATFYFSLPLTEDRRERSKERGMRSEE
jgi:PAS domain S-box-containing protein